MGKIKNLPSLKKEVKRLRRLKKIIVFTNGCFDIIHPGHITLLRQAKRKGDILIVGLNSDSSVRRIKGRKRPIIDETSRAKVIAELEVVDYVIIFSEETPYKLITQIKPDYLVKGGDWDKKNIVGRGIVKKVYRVKLEGRHSTTNIIKKITRSNRP